MSTSSPDKDPERIRRRLSERLEEVAQLAASDLEPELFYREMLQRLLTSLHATAGSVWRRTPAGNLQQLVQFNVDSTKLDESTQARESHEALMGHAATTGQPFHLPPHSTLGPSDTRRPAPGNPTSFLLLVVPVRHKDQVIGLIEVFQPPHRPSLAIPGFLQYAKLMADRCESFEHNRLTK